MVGGMQTMMGVTLQTSYAVRVEAAVIAGVPVRIIYPKGVTSLGKGPVLLNLHGGGGNRPGRSRRSARAPFRASAASRRAVRDPLGSGHPRPPASAAPAAPSGSRRLEELVKRLTLTINQFTTG